MSLLENMLFETKFGEIYSFVNWDGFCEGFNYDTIRDELCDGHCHREISVTNSVSNLNGPGFVREVATISFHL